MASAVLFHHALGLTPGVVAFADRLRSEGHEVATPDLFGGRTFTELEDGVAHASTIGFATVIERGERACASITGPTIFAGMSLGVLPAQKLAQTHAASAGAVLMHACVPPSEFGPVWPEHVPVRIHAMADDPWFVNDGDIEVARTLAESAPDARLVLASGSAHLFTDSSHADYDAAATDDVIDSFLGLLARIDGDQP